MILNLRAVTAKNAIVVDDNWGVGPGNSPAACIPDTPCHIHGTGLALVPLSAPNMSESGVSALVPMPTDEVEKTTAGLKLLIEGRIAARKPNLECRHKTVFGEQRTDYTPTPQHPGTLSVVTTPAHPNDVTISDCRLAVEVTHMAFVDTRHDNRILAEWPHSAVQP